MQTLAVAEPGWPTLLVDLWLYNQCTQRAWRCPFAARCCGVDCLTAKLIGGPVLRVSDWVIEGCELPGQVWHPLCKCVRRNKGTNHSAAAAGADRRPAAGGASLGQRTRAAAQDNGSRGDGGGNAETRPRATQMLLRERTEDVKASTHRRTQRDAKRQEKRGGEQ